MAEENPAAQRQTVTADLKSKQLLLFNFALQETNWLFSNIPNTPALIINKSTALGLDLTPCPLEIIGGTHIKAHFTLNQSPILSFR